MVPVDPHPPASAHLSRILTTYLAVAGGGVTNLAISPDEVAAHQAGRN